MVVVRLVEPTQLADGADPLVHLLLRLGYEIKSAVRGLDVKHKAVLELLPFEGQAGIHLLAAVQVDDPDGLLGVVVLVVLEDIGVTAHAATAQYEPAFLPSLANELGIRKSRVDRLEVKKTQFKIRISFPLRRAECCRGNTQSTAGLQLGC